MDINNKKTLSVYPYIEEIGYSDPISSELLNKQFQSLRESVLRSIIRTQEINTSLTTYESAVNAQAITIANQFQALEFEESESTYITAFDLNNIRASNITHDTAYGYMTLGLVSQYSKIPRGEKYNGKVSSDVVVLVNDEVQEFDSAPYRALDNSLKTVWFDTFDPDTDVTYEIQLPPSLTKRFNYIEINPFPVFGSAITKVQYQDFYGIYHDIDETLYGTHKPIGLHNKAYPTKIYVSPKEFNGTIRITGHTDSTGYFGFSNIDVGFQDFNTTSDEFYLRFDKFVANVDKDITRTVTVDTIDLSYYFDAPKAEALLNGGSVMNAWLLVGTQDKDTGIITPVGGTGAVTSLPFSNNNTITLNTTYTLGKGELLYLKLQFTEHNMTTPVFRGAKLNFSEVTIG